MARKKKRQRRERGSGSLSWDEKRQRWRAISQLGPTKYFRVEEKLQAEAWLAAQSVAAPPATPIRTLDPALDAFLASRAYTKSSTHNNYTLFAKRIALALGDVPVTGITPRHVEAMDKQHREDLSGGYADSMLAFLSTFFEWLLAFEEPGLTRNPVLAYRKGTPARAREGRQAREAWALDYGMCRLLLKELEGDPYQVHIVWLLLTGMRVSELRGLRWVNVRNGEIRIVEQRRGTNRHEPVPLKTKRRLGEGRIIPLASQLLTMTSPGDELVLPARDGSGFPLQSIRNHLNAAAKRAGLAHVRLHDLRHTANNGWHDLGANERQLQALLGHAPRSMTGAYTHPGVASLRPFVEQWAALVLGESGAKVVSIGA